MHFYQHYFIVIERNCCKHVLLYSMYSKQHFELFITFKELSLLWPTSRKKHYYNNEVIFKPKFRHLQGSTDFFKFISMECCVNNSQSICEFNNKLDLRILDRNWIWTQWKANDLHILFVYFMSNLFTRNCKIRTTTTRTLQIKNIFQLLFCTYNNITHPKVPTIERFPV